ncbi:ElyC/SanA/YdcF family protein [Halocatena marina]|uniref:ElyC/SanA/YdcF family protein n=1 Tax=Halocatena marina TaxID=2934937 RepID=UPI00361B3C0D
MRLDDNAQDTKGNGYFTRRIVDSIDGTIETLYLVSSCVHANRAKYIFRQCFGDEHRIDTSHCIETDDSANSAEKIARLRQSDREFFEQITPGDVDAVQRRLAESHDYYSWLSE